MLDLLATTCLPGNSEVSREQLACVTYLMREVFTSCHKWKFKVCSDRHQLGEWVWLVGVASLCVCVCVVPGRAWSPEILSRHSTETQGLPLVSCYSNSHMSLNLIYLIVSSLGVVVATQLLSSPGERGILPLLCLPVSTLDTLHSAALGYCQSGFTHTLTQHTHSLTYTYCTHS